MKLTAMTVTVLGIALSGCAMGEDKAGGRQHAETQPAESWSEPGVSLNANVTRENGFTRIDFAWSGLKEPSILVVNLDSEWEQYSGNRPGTPGYRGLYGITIIRQAGPSDRDTLRFDEARIVEMGYESVRVRAFLPGSLELVVVEDVTVKGGRIWRTQDMRPRDCPMSLTIIPDMAGTNSHVAFREPSLGMMNLDMPPKGGAMVPIGHMKNVRALLRFTIGIEDKRQASIGRSISRYSPIPSNFMPWQGLVMSHLPPTRASISTRRAAMPVSGDVNSHCRAVAGSSQASKMTHGTGAGSLATAAAW